mgnify:CR=1 FL=1
MDVVGPDPGGVVVGFHVVSTRKLGTVADDTDLSAVVAELRAVAAFTDAELQSAELIGAETDVDCGGACPGTCGYQMGCCSSDDCEGSRECTGPAAGCTASEAGTLGKCSTFAPTTSPTASPSDSPSASPSASPSTPSAAPSESPSASPTLVPSDSPTLSPSYDVKLEVCSACNATLSRAVAADVPFDAWPEAAKNKAHAHGMQSGESCHVTRGTP